MNTLQKNRWIVDAFLLIGFLVSFFLNLTGLPLHQLIGIAMALILGYHLFSHWNWVAAVTQRFFGKTSHQARQFYVIDTSLFVGFVVILITGLSMSTWLSLPLTNYAVWRTIHIVASMTTLVVVLYKFGLHARWIVAVGRKIFPSPAALSPTKSPPVRATQNSSRREVLQLMGIISVASLIALSSTAKSLLASEDTQDATGSSANATSNSISSLSTSSGSEATSLSIDSSSSSATCIAQCSHGCSYPGNCRRYVDSNGNNRCDLGEC